MERNEVLEGVRNRVSFLGSSEYQLAISEVANPHDPDKVADHILERRKTYEAGKVSNNGAAMYGSREAYEQAARESDDDARRQLLGESSLLAEADALTAAAKAAQEAADQAKATLSKLWQERIALPDRIQFAQRELNAINSQLARMTDEALRAEYKQWYRELLSSGNAGSVNPLIYAAKAAVLVGADIRREVLHEEINRIEAQLLNDRKRLKQLERQLGKK